MKAPALLALACAASLCAVAADNPFDAFKGKMKEGLYEYKMEMDMGAVPGLPPGMGKQNRTFQHCVTAKDIEKGGVGGGRDGKMPENCVVSNFKMSGNTASYTMTCKGGPDMVADNVVTFGSDSFKMDMKMAMNQGGQPMKINQKMEGKLLGPCK
jgi:hypothetical protein